MNLNTEHLLQIIGKLQVQIEVLTSQLNQAQATVAELQPKPKESKKA
jgi:hypothetical protein